jgi:hypothetical protein
MKFVSGLAPYTDVSPEAAQFGLMLDKALAQQSAPLVYSAGVVGAAEDEAVAIIVYQLLKSCISFIGFETLQQGAPFPRAEFDRLVDEVVEFVASRSGRVCS